MRQESIGFVNGNVITMENDVKKAEAILIEDGKISALGSNDEVRKAADEKNISCIDLTGKTVLPGLHDCHVHIMGTGMAALGVELYDCHSVAEVIELLKEEAKKSDEGFFERLFK